MSDKDEEKMRRCLSCGREFLSSWIGNRICPKCKASPRFRERGLKVVTQQDIKSHRMD
jgi:predicted RNA-binding Zn-ribbon protein involved in translation (DUF1610 family)